jgi:hypothetical protein
VSSLVLLLAKKGTFVLVNVFQPKTFSAVNAPSFGPGGILSTADRAMAWQERSA